MEMGWGARRGRRCWQLGSDASGITKRLGQGLPGVVRGAMGPGRFWAGFPMHGPEGPSLVCALLPPGGTTTVSWRRLRSLANQRGFRCKVGTGSRCAGAPSSCSARPRRRLQLRPRPEITETVRKKTNRQAAKRAKLSSSLDDTFDAVLKQSDVEADEQAQGKSCGFQIREDLRDMDRCNVLHCLEFDHETAPREKIELKA